MHPACRFQGIADMTGNPVLDGLVEVFPQVNFSTLIKVSISFKGDIDAAADYVIQNVLPNIIIHENNTNTNEDLHIHDHQQVSDGPAAHLVIAPAVNDTLSESVPFDVANKSENDDSTIGEQLMQSPAAASTSSQTCLPEENSFESLLAGVRNSLVDDEVIHNGNQQNLMLLSDHIIGGHGDEQIQCSSSAKEKSGLSAFEDNLVLHDNGSPDMNMQLSYSVCIKSLDNAIAAENHKKSTLLSNVAVVSEMLEEVELSEAETQHVVSEASQAGNDILVKVKKLKEMSMLAMEKNNKVAGEVFAEKSILGSEAQGLQSRLFNTSKEMNYFVSIIDEMQQTLQRRLATAEAERSAAETERIKRETVAQEMLKEQEGLLDGAEEESKRLEQQAQENAKLRELLMDKGHIVDALHGEILGIFDNITQLQYRVDTPHSADKPQKLAASNMSRSADSSSYKLAADEPLQLASSNLSSAVESAASKLIIVDEPLQLDSSSLSSSVKSARSKPIPVESTLSSSVKSAPSKQIPVDLTLSSSVKSAPYKFLIDGSLQLASSTSLSSVKSAPSKILVGGPLRLASSTSSSSVKSAPSKLLVGGPLRLASSTSSSSVKSAPSKLLVGGPLRLASSSLSSSVTSPASEYSCSSSKCSSDGKIAHASCHDNFDSDDSWDVVDDD